MLRIKLIGLGNRGMRTLERFRHIPADIARFVEVVDLDGTLVAQAHELLAAQGRPIDGSAGEANVAYICTDWHSHARLAIQEMESGRDTIVEVPLSVSIAECEELEKVCRRTGRRCLMAENCCFDNFHLACLEMARQGLFGTITHLEGAYIHTIGADGDPTKPWMVESLQTSGGNTYPTHAYGPIAQLLALDGDGLDSLQSLSSALTQGLNTTLIRTRKGRSVLLFLDVSTPRPYSRMQTICGTEGFAQKYPVPTLQLKGMDTPAIGDEALRLADKYLVGEAASYWQEGQRLGIENPMNYAMDCRMMRCLATGERFEVEIGEGAEWSSLIELTRRAAEEAQL